MGLLNFTPSYLYQLGKSSLKLLVKQVQMSYSALCYSSQQIHKIHYITNRKTQQRVLRREGRREHFQQLVFVMAPSLPPSFEVQ